MKFEKDTERAEVTIKGLKVNVPAPFTEGHECTANEAAVLNQILRENVRNNNARAAAAVIEAAGGDADKVDLKAFQKSIDDYVAEYEFGVRRAGGSGRTLDPVEKEAKRLAVEVVKLAVREQGFSIADIGGMGEINKFALEYLDGENGDALREQAKQNLAARAETAAAGIGLTIKKASKKAAAA